MIEALAAARRYNALARQHGLTPTRMALAWCYGKWQVASTILGVTSVAQLDEVRDEGLLGAGQLVFLVVGRCGHRGRVAGAAAGPAFS